MGANEGTISKWLSETERNCNCYRAESHGTINTWKILVICDNIVIDPKINQEKLHAAYRQNIKVQSSTLAYVHYRYSEILAVMQICKKTADIVNYKFIKFI